MNVETILAGKGRDVLTVAPDATVADAVAALKSRRVGAAVVSTDVTLRIPRFTAEPPSLRKEAFIA